MEAHASIKLADHGLEFRCPAAGLREDRPLSGADREKLEGWAKRYQKLAREDGNSDELLKLGGEIHEWLDGADRFLNRLLEPAEAPL